jgi:hypothetical protein
VEIASVGANVQSYADTSVTAGANYCYRIKAFNSGGVSSPTNAACATAPSGSNDDGGGGGGGGSTPSPTPNPGQPITPPVPPVPVSPAFDDWKDYQLRLTLRSSDNDTLGVMFRYQDPNNYYRFTWYSQGKTRQLEKRVNGNFQVLARDQAAYTPGQSYDIQITARGTGLTVAVDGKTVFSVSDSSFNRGTIGMFSYYNAGSQFDDIHVQDLVTGATLASDDFNDHDYTGWTIIDDGTENGPSKWSAATGALTQSTNIGGDQVGTYALYTGGSWSDYRMTVKMRSTDDDRMGVLFRFKDNNNHYRFVWSKEDRSRALLKKVNGQFTMLAQDAVAYNTNQTYNVEVVVQGSSLKINIDGKDVFAVTDTSMGSGSVALFTSRNQASFDDVLVEDLKSKTVLLDADFADGKLTGWKAFDEPGANSGPSDWKVIDRAVVQSSNTGSDGTGFPGTFLLY